MTSPLISVATVRTVPLAVTVPAKVALLLPGFVNVIRGYSKLLGILGITSGY